MKNLFIIIITLIIVSVLSQNRGFEKGRQEGIRIGEDLMYRTFEQCRNGEISYIKYESEDLLNCK